MKKLFLAILMCLGLSVSAGAQTHTFPATDTNNTFTGANIFTNSTTLNLVTYTIGTLPSPVTTPVGTIASVTDAFTAGGCTTGGGVSLSLCRNNGTFWDSLGGGGGATFPPVGIAVSNGSGWAAAATATNVINLFTGTCNSSTFLRADGACQFPTPTGNVSNSGVPVNGQMAQWVTSTTIQGVTILPTTAVPAFTGDVTNSAGSLATTVGKINGTSLAGLATGLLKNTTATGVPSIATSTDIIADFSGTCNSGTFLRGDGTCNAPAGAGNVSTSGSPAAHQTAVWASGTTILGVAPGTSGFPLVSGGASADPSYAQLSLTAGVTGTLPVANGGTGTASTLVGVVRGGSPLTASELSGDVTTSGSNAVVVKKINGVTLSSLATGILKNTTTTGVPSIAVAADILGLWSGSCSSSTFLNGAGACATPPGTISGQANGVIPLATSSTGITSQSHLDDGITTAATITSTETINAPNLNAAIGNTTPAAGHFTTLDTIRTGLVPDSTVQKEYLQSLLNSCSPATEYFANHANQSLDAIAGCIASGVAATGQANAVAGYCTTLVNSCVGGYFQSRNLANNTFTDGINGVVQDIAGLTTGVSMIGSDVDVYPLNASGVYNILTGYNAALFAPIAGSYGNGFLCQQFGGGVGVWGACFSSANGASNDIGFAIGARSGGTTSIYSQSIAWGYYDSGAVGHQVKSYVSPTGLLTFTGNGIQAVNGACGAPGFGFGDGSGLIEDTSSGTTLQWCLGSNPRMRLGATAGAGLDLWANESYAWNNSNVGGGAGTVDTMISRGAAGQVTADTTATGNALGTFKAAAIIGRTPTGIFNFNQAAQSQVVVSATEYYITRSDLDMPAAYVTAIAAGTTMKWRVSLTKTAAGTGTFQVLLKKGTNGSTADTSIVTQTIGTQTAAADNMEMDIQLTWTSATAAYWTIIPHQSAASGTGFGLVYPAAAAQFTGTISGQTTTTASDKYGLSLIFTTGTPTFVVNEVQAQAFGVN